MSVTITATNGAGTSNPFDVLMPYSASRAGNNVIHDLIGGGIAVSFVAPRARSGTILYPFRDDAAAAACVALHAQKTSFILSVPDRPSLAMTYVVSGDVRAELGETSWTVSVAFQEVDAS